MCTFTNSVGSRAVCFSVPWHDIDYKPVGVEQSFVMSDFTGKEHLL